MRKRPVVLTSVNPRHVEHLAGRHERVYEVVGKPLDLDEIVLPENLVKKLNEALWLAEQLDLDLVEVAPNAKPPVCRLMDYGKYKYEQSVKAREARKKQTRTTIKELRMKVRIGEHDFDITRRKAQEFLEEGDKVKVTIRFRGREQERPAFGKDLLDRLAEDLLDVAVTEQTPKLEGRSMTMVLAPTKRVRAPVEVDAGESDAGEGEHSDDE